MLLISGKIYKIEYSKVDNNYGNPIRTDGLVRYAWWYDLRPVAKSTESLIKNKDVHLSFYSTSLSSLFSNAYYFGVDMDPDYQREYVWSEEDKVALIDSIFNNIDIGKFVFVHKDYGEDFLYEILDGKQRMRAILDYFENRFPYKGKYFNDLCNEDRNWFENKIISVAEIPDTNKNVILKYFVMLNSAGKTMDKRNLERVKGMMGDNN